jgi:hypothetical protein
VSNASTEMAAISSEWMKGLHPSPVEDRTICSVLMACAHASRFDIKPVGRMKDEGHGGRPYRGLTQFVPGANRKTVLHIERRELHDFLHSHLSGDRSSRLVSLRDLRVDIDEIKCVGAVKGFLKRDRIREISGEEVDAIAK